MTSDNPILIVEDEPKIAALLEEYLQEAGHSTHWIDNGDDVDGWVREHHPAVILLDLMLPGRDGLSVCQHIRTYSTVPIIMITAKVEEIDRLLGLELGADDYVCKPFSPREVVARVKALLRRLQMMEAGPASSYRGIAIDEERFVASIDGNVLDLTRVEFRMLKILASVPGRVYSRDQLMDAIYTDGRIVSDRTVDSHVKNLRQKIQAATGSDDLVHSIYGVGYKLE